MLQHSKLVDRPRLRRTVGVRETDHLGGLSAHGIARENISATDCTDFARFAVQVRAAFCRSVPNSISARFIK